MTTNNGDSWTQVNNGLTNNSIVSLFANGTTVFAGSSGDGVFKRPISELIGIEIISSEIPSSFSLEQNYPNPFNPFTKIIFAVPKNSFVTLKIFDALGREVEGLVQPARPERLGDRENRVLRDVGGRVGPVQARGGEYLHALIEQRGELRFS